VTLFSGWPDQTFKSDITYIAANKKSPTAGALAFQMQKW